MVGSLEVIEGRTIGPGGRRRERDDVAEGEHRGRSEELKKMKEFKLHVVVSRREALEK